MRGFKCRDFCYGEGKVKGETTSQVSSNTGFDAGDGARYGPSFERSRVAFADEPVPISAAFDGHRFRSLGYAFLSPSFSSRDGSTSRLPDGYNAGKGAAHGRVGAGI